MAEAAADQLVPMIELVVSKMLQQSDFTDLLSKHLPAIEEMPNMPENVRASLEVANQMVARDLRGESNFDAVVTQLKSGQKEVILRVFHTDTSGSGKALLQGIQEANQKLQNRSNKMLHLAKCLEDVMQIDATSDMEGFVKLISGVTDLGIVEEDLATSKDFGAKAKEIANLIVATAQEVIQKCDFDQAFSFLANETVIDTGIAAAFFASLEVKNVEAMATLLQKPAVKDLVQVCDKKDTFVPAAVSILDLLHMAPWISLSASHLKVAHRPRLEMLTAFWNSSSDNSANLCLATFPSFRIPAPHAFRYFLSFSQNEMRYCTRTQFFIPSYASVLQPLAPSSTNLFLFWSCFWPNDTIR